MVALGAILELSITSNWGASVTLAWDPSPGIDIAGYRLYYGPLSRNYTNVIDTGTATTGAVPGLTAGTSYYFAVTAYTVAGLESDYSAEISYTPAPPAAARLHLAISPSKQPVLTGTGSAGYTYDLQVSPDLSTWTKIGTITVDQADLFQFTDPQVAGATTRYYRLGNPH